MQNLTAYSYSATPISYYGDEISRLSRVVIEIPIFCYLGVLSFFGYLATSDAKSDVIFLLGDPDFLLGRWNFASIFLSYRDPHFGLFGVLWGVLGVFSYFRCKIWRHILARRPDFLLGRRNFAPIFLSYRDPHFGLFGVFWGFLGGI